MMATRKRVTYKLSMYTLAYTFSVLLLAIERERIFNKECYCDRRDSFTINIETCICNILTEILLSEYIPYI